MKIIEVDSRVDRLSRQLRDEKLRNARAFDQGAAMVVNALRSGASLDEVSEKIRWALVDDYSPATASVKKALAEAPIPVEFEDSEEHTEPTILLEFEYVP